MSGLLNLTSMHFDGLLNRNVDGFVNPRLIGVNLICNKDIFSIAVVGRAFPMINYVRILSIWNNLSIMCHWKCPAYNCKADYMGETNTSLKERVSDDRNQTTSATRIQHTSTNHPKEDLKDFTIIDRDSNTLHHQARETLHTHIKDLSLNRNIGKDRIPSVFIKLLKPHTQLEEPHSFMHPPKGDTFFTWSFNTKDN